MPDEPIIRRTQDSPTEKTRVAKGEAIYIPGGTEHHITNTGKEALRRFYIFDTGAFADVGYNKKSPNQELKTIPQPLWIKKENKHN